MPINKISHIFLYLLVVALCCIKPGGNLFQIFKLSESVYSDVMSDCHFG